jgi:hypothetical protein
MTAPDALRDLAERLRAYGRDDRKLHASVTPPGGQCVCDGCAAHDGADALLAAREERDALLRSRDEDKAAYLRLMEERDDLRAKLASQAEAVQFCHDHHSEAAYEAAIEAGGKACRSRSMVRRAVAAAERAAALLRAPVDREALARALYEVRWLRGIASWEDSKDHEFWCRKADAILAAMGHTEPTDEAVARALEDAWRTGDPLAYRCQSALDTVRAVRAATERCKEGT